MTDDRRPISADSITISVGLEEGRDGAVLVHALAPAGCVAGGASRDEALAAFEVELMEWLDEMVGLGRLRPEPDAELEIAVDEWIRTDTEVAGGESVVCFDADLRPLGSAEIEEELHRLGDLRSLLLDRVRRLREPDLDRETGGGWTLRQALDELARAQWWTLSRLGSSPLADVPGRTLARLDTAMALVVQQFTRDVPQDPDRRVELDGEEWTPRKVLRRLLELEWTLGRVIRAAIPTE